MTRLSKSCGISVVALLAVQGIPVYAGNAIAKTNAQAKADISQSLEEVTVTAQKRPERLIDVPVAANVFTANTLARYGTANLTALSNQAPGVRFDDIPAGSGSGLTIRGIGSAWSDTSIDSSVVVDIDGVPLSRGRIVSTSMFDMASVDILKGPQALYYGKNSTAGVVSETSANPTDTWQGYAKFGYETEAQEYYSEAAVGGPVTSTLGVRLAVRVSDMLGGWEKNVAKPIADPFEPGKTLPGAASSVSPQQKNIGARFTAVWKPNSRFDATLKVFGSHYHDNGNFQLAEVMHCAPGYAHPAVWGVQDPYGDCALNGITSNGMELASRAAHYPMNLNGRPYSQFDNYLTSLRLNYRLHDVTFTSITGWYWYLESENDNYDDTVYDQLGGADAEHYQTITQEVRAATSFNFPVNFVTGIFFEHETRNLRTSGAILDVGPDPLTGQTNNYQSYAKDHGTVISPFIAFTWKILPTVELSGGARYTHESKYGSEGYTFVNQIFETIVPLLPQGTRISAPLSENNVSPQVSLSWHPSHNAMLYVSYKTGYKSGGFANPTIMTVGTTGKDLLFRDERADGWEIGSKASLLGGRLSGDLTFYRYNYSNLQVTAFDAATTSFSVQNAASAVTQGVELNAIWQVTNDLRLRANGSYNDAHYASFPDAACWGSVGTQANCTASGENLTGAPLYRAPKFAGTAGFTYEHRLLNKFTGELTSDLRYTSGYFLDPSENPFGYQKGFTTVDASLRIIPDNSSWVFAIIGSDLTNKYYAIAGVNTPGGPAGQYSGYVARPREIRIQISYNF